MYILTRIDTTATANVQKDNFSSVRSLPEIDHLFSMSEVKKDGS